jgi:hypothetical protein
MGGRRFVVYGASVLEIYPMEALRAGEEDHLQWIRINKLHQDTMSRLIKRFRYGKSMFMQDLHERELFLCGQPRHVHP